MEEWPAQLVEDALERIVAESARRREQEAEERRRGTEQRSRGYTLGDEWPELEG